MVVYGSSWHEIMAVDDRVDTAGLEQDLRVVDVVGAR
jgi:hypothetical protein